MSKYLRPDEPANTSPTRVRSTHPNSRRTRNAFVMAIIAVAVLLLVLSTRLTRPANVMTPGREDESVAVVPSSASGRTALAYVEAVQNEDFEQVFKMTQWMQERRKQLLLENDPETAHRGIDAFYRQERDDFFATGVGSTLTEEGIPDAHLFPPDSIPRMLFSPHSARNVSSDCPLLGKG